MSNRPEPTRLYARIASAISRKIDDGHYPIGRRLPAERELSQIYAVSRQTIREAVIALEIDGLVEVRTGSGIYVLAARSVSGREAVTDIGPFELLEARRAVESEACALAATRISAEELAALDALVLEMAEAREIHRSEDADHRFHQVIARSTRNSAMAEIVEGLWSARARSPQTRFLGAKAREAGITPGVQDHAAIVAALRTGSPEAARAAMTGHLSQVLDALFAATEVHEVELARARIATERRRYVAPAPADLVSPSPRLTGTRP